jgi:hypothetical protein
MSKTIELNICSNCSNTLSGYGNLCPRCGHTIPTENAAEAKTEQAVIPRHTGYSYYMSSSIGGIDDDVKQIFLSLPPEKLSLVFRLYGQRYGGGAQSYAQSTYYSWRSGRVRMSGMVAGRLLNLVPPVLDPPQRFELVKKVRSAHLRKERKYISCHPTDWRHTVGPIVAQFIAASQNVQIPPYVLDRVCWLADGDAAAAQRLLAAAEQEEAAVRLHFLEAEFKRIDFMLQNIEATKRVSHTIELPQGTITVSIAVPRKGFWSCLGSLLS